MNAPRSESRQRRSDRLLDEFYQENDRPYEAGMLLDDRPPVRLSDGESSSELDGQGDGRVYCNNPFANITSARSQSVAGSIPMQQQSHEDKSVRALLQEQQMLLRDILSKQDVIEAKQTSFEHKLTKLEEEVATRNTTTPTSSDSSPCNKKRKRVVSRELSVSTSK